MYLESQSRPFRVKREFYFRRALFLGRAGFAVSVVSGFFLCVCVSLQRPAGLPIQLLVFR